MIQLPTEGHGLSNRILPRFFYTAVALAASLGPLTTTSVAADPKCFPVFDGLLFTNKPNLKSEGLQPVTVVGPDHWLLSGQSPGTIPGPSSIKKGLSGNAASTVLALDEEGWPTQGPPNVVAATVSKYLTLLSAVRTSGAQNIIGYYAMPPIRDYWRAIGAASSQPYLAWQAENDQLQPIADAVDVLFPSLYTFYDDQAGWAKYAIANITEAHRLARGKPVYAFIWPQYHSSNKKLAMQLIDGPFWALQLQTVAQYADGVVIWGGYQLPWNEQADWWQATQRFLQARQACVEPNAPRDLSVQP